MGFEYPKLCQAKSSYCVLPKEMGRNGFRNTETFQLFPSNGFEGEL